MSTTPGATDPDAIDSTCNEVPIGTEGSPTARCGNDAVAVVTLPDGHRAYVCEAHAGQVNRFGDRPFADGPPTIVRCDRCHKPTPRSRADFVDRICEGCQNDG
jgi:hypothetical protein